MTSNLSIYNIVRPANHLEHDVEDWRQRAVCVDTGDVFFIESASAEATAKGMCKTCPVIAECLAYAMDYEGNLTAGGRFGVYGGLTGDERAARARKAARRG